MANQDFSVLRVGSLEIEGSNAIRWLGSSGTVGPTAGAFSGTISGTTITASVALVGGTIDGTTATLAKIIATGAANPATGQNVAYITQTENATFTGSLVGIRTTVTCAADGVAIGNVYAGRFELIQSKQPSSQGHTTALYAQTTVTVAANNPTSVMSLVLAGASGGNATPFINFIDASTDKTLYLFEIGTGGAVADAGDGTALFETSAAIGNINEITHGLRVKVNGADYYILLATAAAVAS